MPRCWNLLDGDIITKNSNEWAVLDNDRMSFDSKVVEYISMRYPFAQIIDIRDSGQPNIYEGHTLKLLHDRCHAADINVLYMHSKGVRKSGNACVANWREILNHFCISEWKTCIKHLETADVVGVQDKISPTLMSGNFWWSKSSHIKTLPEPLDSTQYDDYTPNHPGQINYRFAFEKWVLVNSPSINYMVSTDTNHYRSYCFLENLVGNNL
jgi:hypothetical protein